MGSGAGCNLLVTVAKMQTFSSHIRRNLKLTTVSGIAVRKRIPAVLLHFATGLGRHSHKVASLPRWTSATGNRSATLSLDFKMWFPSSIWRQHRHASAVGETLFRVGRWIGAPTPYLREKIQKPGQWGSFLGKQSSYFSTKCTTDVNSRFLVCS